MRRWPFVAILIGNLLAATVLFLAGVFYERTNQYDGCQYVAFGNKRFWACPISEPERVPPAEERA